MRTIKYTKQFKKDYRREKKTQHSHTLDQALLLIVKQLSKDETLLPKHRDHALIGNGKTIGTAT